MCARSHIATDNIDEDDEELRALYLTQKATETERRDTVNRTHSTATVLYVGCAQKIEIIIFVYKLNVCIVVRRCCFRPLCTCVKALRRNRGNMYLGRVLTT